MRSWLIDLTHVALSRGDFNKLKPKIMSVTIKELNDTKKAVKAYTPAFDTAVRIRRDESSRFKLGKRMIAGIRREFGGHGVKK